MSGKVLVLQRFSTKQKTKLSDREEDGGLPADGFFDLLWRAAIFFGQAEDGLPEVVARGDYSSGDSRSRDI